MNPHKNRFFSFFFFFQKKKCYCAWGITRSGEKVLLHIDLGNRESYDDWLEFLRDMINRGLHTPISITSDGAPGLMKAIDAVFPNSIRIRCWFHRMENFSNKVPTDLWPEIKCELIKGLCPFYVSFLKRNKIKGILYKY